MKKITYIFIFAVVIVLGVVYFNNQPNQEPLTTEDAEIGVPTISSLSIVNAASAVLSNAKTITWQTNNYPAGAKVNINLLRQISDSPRKFVVVRTIVTDTPNDGQETLIPKAGENSNDLYIEVTCSSTYQFKSGCKVSSEVLKVN